MKKSFHHILVLSFLIFTISFLNKGCKKDDEPTNVTDIEGNVYKIVTINNKIWMAENLKTTKLNDNTSIPNTKPSNDSWDWYHYKTFAYCWYNNDPTNRETYGALYNWYTISSGKLCPNGWHVPTENEFKELTTFIGPLMAGKLKESGTAHWESPNSDATDELRFTALPAGYTTSGFFFGIGNKTLLWSATEVDTDNAYEWSMSQNPSMDRESVAKEFGASVRCIKD
jgi:uncharacterized protein (TIGR02145 family)